MIYNLYLCGYLFISLLSSAFVITLTLKQNTTRVLTIDIIYEQYPLPCAHKS